MKYFKLLKKLKSCGYNKIERRNIVKKGLILNNLEEVVHDSVQKQYKKGISLLNYNICLAAGCSIIAANTAYNFILGNITPQNTYQGIQNLSVGTICGLASLVGLGITYDFMKKTKKLCDTYKNQIKE